MIDSLKAYDDLKKGEFSEEQTRGLVAVFQAVTEAMTEAVDSALEKRDLALEKKLSVFEKSIKAEIEKVKSDVIKWCIGVVLAACAIGFGIIVNFLK